MIRTRIVLVDSGLTLCSKSNLELWDELILGFDNPFTFSFMQDTLNHMVLIFIDDSPVSEIYVTFFYVIDLLLQ